jgi:hypothetical protein
MLPCIAGVTGIWVLNWAHMIIKPRSFWRRQPKNFQKAKKVYAELRLGKYCSRRRVVHASHFLSFERTWQGARYVLANLPAWRQFNPVGGGVSADGLEAGFGVGQIPLAAIWRECKSGEVLMLYNDSHT